MLRRVALVRTDVSEEHIASSIGVKRMGELGTTFAVTSNRSTLRIVLQLLVTANIVSSLLVLSTLLMEAMRSSETSVPTNFFAAHFSC
jgi:hypothetical protein